MHVSSESSSPAKRGLSTKRRVRTKDHAEIGAPAVWIVPDWATYPVLEHFYGHAKRARSSSFYEVMCSPTNATATTTLGASCVRDPNATTATSRRRSSFGGVYTSFPDTSDERYSLDTESLVDDCPVLREPRRNRHNRLFCTTSGYAQWHRMRRTMSLHGDLVPVPRALHGTSARSLSLVGNGEFSIDVTPLDCSNLDRPQSPLTSSRLRAKLQESLHDTDERMTEEYKRLEEAQRIDNKSRALQPVAPVTIMWSLICGAQPPEAVPADGLTFLTEKMGIAVSHRALNQLQRHRRHVCGILQIVTAHNPDLELTERQLDSFEAPDAMLANDIKYVVLYQQYQLLRTSATQRRFALVEAKRHHGSDCFEKPQVKCVMMSKLLKAVSWYRLMQRNAREKSASSSVGVVSASTSVVDTPPSSSGSDGGLQKLQVETILDVLAGEDFYSVFNESMCQPNWWAIAQAHFENLIFSSKNSRICQWMLQLSKDVAAVSYEKLENDKSDGPRRTLVGDSVHCNHHMLHQSSWTRDPPPEQILEFLDRLAGRVRREFDVPAEVSKSLNVFIQRTVFSRITVLCFNQRATRDCQHKDKLWRKKCVELSGLPMEKLGVLPDLVAKIHSSLPSHCVREPSGSNSPCQRRVFFVRAIEAFNGMASVVPCDLLDELMHGVVILHHEAALVLGTTHFSVETFFPLLAYVLVHCRLPTIHAQLHLLENFAITAHNANGEESYYVYCVHAAVEYVCNTAEVGLGGKCADTCARSTSSSTVSTPEGASVAPALPMNSSSLPTSFSLDLALEKRLKVGSPCKSRVKQSEAA